MRQECLTRETIARTEALRLDEIFCVAARGLKSFSIETEEDMTTKPHMQQQTDPDPSNRERSIPMPDEEKHHSQPEPDAPEPDPLKQKIHGGQVGDSKSTVNIG